MNTKNDRIKDKIPERFVSNFKDLIKKKKINWMNDAIAMYTNTIPLHDRNSMVKSRAGIKQMSSNHLGWLSAK